MIAFYSTGQCPVCTCEISEDEAVCSFCTEILEKSCLSEDGRCRVCFYMLQEGVCRNCTGKNIFFDSHRALYRLNRAWSLVLHRWKFENDRRAGNCFSHALGRILAGGLPDVDEICYIDSGRSGFDVRAYQPCRDPALYLGGILGKEVSGGIRKHGRFRQSGKRRMERYRDLRGSFGAGKNFHKKRILLLEDVFTTGATANECARVLKSSGASEVHLICLLMREDMEL